MPALATEVIFAGWPIAAGVLWVASFVQLLLWHHLQSLLRQRPAVVSAWELEGQSLTAGLTVPAAAAAAAAAAIKAEQTAKTVTAAEAVASACRQEWTGQGQPTAAGAPTNAA